MKPSSTHDGSIFDTPENAARSDAGDEPQVRQRERSGILGEPAGIAPGTTGQSDGSERDDPIQEQAPQDGGDHWRR